MKREPTFFGPVGIKNCAVDTSVDQQHFVRIRVGGVPVECVSAKPTIVEFLVHPFGGSTGKMARRTSKWAACLGGAGSVFDLGGSSIEMYPLGSLQDDYRKIGNDFKAIGDDLRHVLANEKRKAA